MKKIKDYNHACEVLGRDPEARPDVSKMIERDRKPFSSLHELTTIIEAQNKLNDWEVDWNNHDQGKYYPWMDVDKDYTKAAGVGLSFLNFAFTYSFTCVGSRLVVGSIESAKYIGETFLSLYEDWFLVIK